MNLVTYTLIFLLLFSGGMKNHSIQPGPGDNVFTGTAHQPDSLRDRQHLYNGVLWNNNYRRIEGDPYLFTNIFLPADIYFNGKHFAGVKIRYDIYADEIMIPRNLDQIIILNKEMVDSFSIKYNDRIFNFINNHPDSLTGSGGYLNILYKGRTDLYVKYEKRILTEVTDQNDGEFSQRHKILLVTGNRVHELNRLKDILNIAGDQKDIIRRYVNENRIKVTRKQPDSFIPLVRLYDSLKMGS